MKYEYFIVYSVALPNGNGVGNIVVTVDGEIDSLESIREVEATIAKIVGSGSIVITNFRLLKTEKV